MKHVGENIKRISSRAVGIVNAYLTRFRATMGVGSLSMPALFYTLTFLMSMLGPVMAKVGSIGLALSMTILAGTQLLARGRPAIFKAIMSPILLGLIVLYFANGHELKSVRFCSLCWSIFLVGLLNDSMLSIFLALICSLYIVLR